MAKKEDAKENGQNQKSRKRQWIPILILFICILIALLISQKGCNPINNRFCLDFRNSNYYELSNQAKIGVQYSHNFSSTLIPLVNGTGHIFYLGYDFGFPPHGLILYNNGILSGIPTDKGDKFQVCVINSMGKSACKLFHLTVNSGDYNNDNNNYGGCPKTSCDTGDCCGAAGATTPDGIHSQVAGVLTRDYCECPNDTEYSGTTDVVSPGGPWKICNCK